VHSGSRKLSTHPQGSLQACMSHVIVCEATLSTQPKAQEQPSKQALLNGRQQTPMHFTGFRSWTLRCRDMDAVKANATPVICRTRCRHRRAHSFCSHGATNERDRSAPVDVKTLLRSAGSADEVIDESYTPYQPWFAIVSFAVRSP